MEEIFKNYEVYSFRLEKYPDYIWFLKKSHFGRN